MAKRKHSLTGSCLTSNSLIADKSQQKIIQIKLFVKRVFNGWKKMAITEKVKKDQAYYQDAIKIENIKNSRANTYYNNKLREKY
jgi:hypothetical protein